MASIQYSSSFMITRQFLRLSKRNIPQADDLTLIRFAREQSISGIPEKLTSYIKSKEEYDSLIKKYEIFGGKEKSIEDSARMVGLELPRNR
jgi:predicted helicase